jgi:hypothetical protein
MKQKVAKDLRAFAPAAIPSHPDTLSTGTLHSQNIARLWLERAGEQKRAFFQVFRNPFPLAGSALAEKYLHGGNTARVRRCERI